MGASANNPRELEGNLIHTVSAEPLGNFPPTIHNPWLRLSLRGSGFAVASLPQAAGRGHRPFVIAGRPFACLLFLCLAWVGLREKVP